MLYRVVWEIDIDAESPTEAARQALEIQRDERSDATVFKVAEWGEAVRGEWVEVDPAEVYYDEIQEGVRG